MIWLAERIAALVVIIIGTQILFRLLRSWWHSPAWLRTSVVFVLNGAWHIWTALALFFALLTTDLERAVLRVPRRSASRPRQLVVLRGHPPYIQESL